MNNRKTRRRKIKLKNKTFKNKKIFGGLRISDDEFKKFIESKTENKIDKILENTNDQLKIEINNLKKNYNDLNKLKNNEKDVKIKGNLLKELEVIPTDIKNKINDLEEKIRKAKAEKELIAKKQAQKKTPAPIIKTPEPIKTPAPINKTPESKSKKPTPIQGPNKVQKIQAEKPLSKNEEKIKKMINNDEIFKKLHKLQPNLENININIPSKLHLPNNFFDNTYNLNFFNCSNNTDPKVLQEKFKIYVNKNYGSNIKKSIKPEEKIETYYNRNRTYLQELKCTGGTNQYIEFISLMNQFKNFIKKYDKKEIDTINTIISNPNNNYKKSLPDLIRDNLNMSSTQNPSGEKIINLFDEEKKNIIKDIIKFIFSKSKGEFHTDNNNDENLKREDLKKLELRAYFDLFKILSDQAEKEKEKEKEPVPPSNLLDSIADMIRSVETKPETEPTTEDPSQLLDSIADMIRSVEKTPEPEPVPEDPSRLLDSIADMIRSVEKPPEPQAVPVDPSQLLDSIADMIRSVEKKQAPEPEPEPEPENPSRILDSIADMIRSIEKEQAPEPENPSRLLDSIADMIRSVEKEPSVAAQPSTQSSTQPVIAIALAPTPEQVPKSTTTQVKAQTTEQTDQEMTNDNIIITQSDNSSKQQPIYKYGYNIIDSEVKETQYIPPISVN